MYRTEFILRQDEIAKEKYVSYNFTMVEWGRGRRGNLRRRGMVKEGKAAIRENCQEQTYCKHSVIHDLVKTYGFFFTCQI